MEQAKGSQAQEKKPPFDVAVCESLRHAITNVLAGFPEVRSIAVSVDYHGALNDADINKGIWLGEAGPVTSPDAIFGSVFQTLRMLETQCGRALQLMEQMRENVEVLGAEALKRHEEIQRLDQEIARKTAQAGGSGTSTVAARQEEAQADQGKA